MSVTPRLEDDHPGAAGPDRYVLPPRARLLHIGVPKSGTTTLQRAAAQNRLELLRHGVRYPGRQLNHRLGVSALMGRRVGWSGEDERGRGIVPWERLVQEIEADPERRIFLSHEAVSESTDEQAARFRDRLGPNLHVVVTLRGYAAILGPSWQQYVRSGVRRSFESWLKTVLADPPAKEVTPGFLRRADQGALVQRWVSLLGADRVIVVIGDKSNHDLLTDAFADLLGLPRALLRLGAAVGGFQTNRSLSLPEVELIRALNGRVRGDNGLDWEQFGELVRGGAIARLQEMRVPPADEPPVLLPEWAAEKASAHARAHAEAIAQSGCRVIGDLEALYAPVRTCTRVPMIEAVPVSAAAEALAGLAFAAVGKPFVGRFVEVPDAEPGALGRVVGAERHASWRAADRATVDLPTSSLVAVAVLRQVRAARRTVRRLQRGT